MCGTRKTAPTKSKDPKDPEGPEGSTTDTEDCCEQVLEEVKNINETLPGFSNILTQIHNVLKQIRDNSGATTSVSSLGQRSIRKDGDGRGDGSGPSGDGGRGGKNPHGHGDRSSTRGRADHPSKSGEHWRGGSGHGRWESGTGHGQRQQIQGRMRRLLTAWRSSYKGGVGSYGP